MNMYLLLKSLHLISVISWMAGLLYLPRIFVYHSENKDNQNTSEIFKTMEKKLFNYIMMPAMIFDLVVWLIFGFLFGIFSVFRTLDAVKSSFCTIINILSFLSRKMCKTFFYKSKCKFFKILQNN